MNLVSKEPTGEMQAESRDDGVHIAEIVRDRGHIYSQELIALSGCGRWSGRAR
jgi:hypothetical protein